MTNQELETRLKFIEDCLDSWHEYKYYLLGQKACLEKIIKSKSNKKER